MIPGVAGLYVTGYVAMIVVYVAFMFVPGRIGTTERERLLGSQLQRWPSLTLADELSPARRFAITLVNEEPDTCSVTARGAWFYWDPAVDRSRLRELSCQALRASSLSGPARLVIVSFDKGAAEDLVRRRQRGGRPLFSRRLLRAAAASRDASTLPGGRHQDSRSTC